MKLTPALLTLAVLPALKADGLDVELRLSRLEHPSVHGTDGSVTFQASPDASTALNLRFAHALTPWAKGTLKGYAAIHALETTSFQAGWGNFWYREGELKFRNEGFSLGLQNVWGQRWELGLSAEVRYEHFQMVGGQAETSSLLRPWMHVSIGRPFPQAPFHPFVGLEVGAPLTSRREARMTLFNGTPVPDSASWMRAMAPTSEVSLVCGIRY